MVVDTRKIGQMMRALTKTDKGESVCSLKIEGVEFFQKKDIETNAPIREDHKAAKARLIAKRSKLIARRKPISALECYLNVLKGLKKADYVRSWLKHVNETALQKLSTDDYKKLVVACKAREAELDR